MKTLRNFTTILLASSVISTAAFAENRTNQGTTLEGVTGTLKNVQQQIETAIIRAEKFYEELHGGNLPGNQDYDLVGNNSNPYISVLKVKNSGTPKYRVVMELQSNRPANTGLTQNAQNVQTPIAQALRGKKFVFIPVVGSSANNPNEKITSWECITDADDKVEEFYGDKGNVENTKSYISSTTDFPYLNTCIYKKNLSSYF